ncbi:class I SAM-dependent methyltransferase [Glaciecola sp. MH2013]|uniref:methyltransferase domain-containing protein n=1 Tax=Glaciecola sp. MH2013 TaxID=2785524 RepID=UPI00189F9955|nr:class I SAM-dependent methyltransferase [Glaciecola sp. MH2013]MBF7073116.1 class I SAM-dependent methyltransferase [Glaciecola sp. MH2013]
MKNEDVIEYYDTMAANIKVATETRNKAKDFSKFDIAFMKERAGSNKKLLDLGSGTGLLVNELIDDFEHITAVERYANFSKFITKSPKVTVINADVLEFETEPHSADIVSLFGVMNYFNKEEATRVYKKAQAFIKPTGMLVIKNQLGVDEDVTVAGFSEEIGRNYYSNYRHIDSEVQLLASLGFKNIEVCDIYPAEYNRWENTHFYAITANV